MKPSCKSFPLLLIFIFLPLLFISCSEKEEVIIREQKFIDLYAHILILNEFADDSLAEIITTDLLDSARITPMQIDSTLKFYRKNPERWVEVMRQIRDRIKELRSIPLNLDSLEFH